MSLSKKYGIPEETIKLMIKDGWLSCSVAKCEEVIVHYKKHISQGIPKPEAVHRVADEIKVSESYIYRIMKKFE